MPSYTPPYGAGDSVAAQTMYNLKVFTDWLANNGQAGKGIVTEVGIPGSSLPGTDPIPGSGTGAKFDQRWDNVFQQWFEAANRANLHVTAWNASNWNVDLRAYRNDDGNTKPLNYRTTVSSVLENNLGNGGVLRGVNLAGAEFSDRGPNGSLDLSHFSEPNAGYYYPLSADYATLYSRGMTLIRVPIRWERIQRTLKGPLDTNEMAELTRSINAAGAAGCQVLLDLHNYARYDTNPTGQNANGVYTIGQNAPATHNNQAVGGTMTSCFVDLWTKIAQYYNGNSAIWGYDICNEPHDCPGGVSDWQDASRQAVEAIRAVNTTVKIAVEGYLYASVPGWLSQNGANAWLTTTIPAGQPNAGQARNNDPNILWNGHHYFDMNYNGGFEDTYDAEVTAATNAGFSSWSTSGYSPPPTYNTTQTGFRTVFKAGFDSVGEFGGQYDAITQGSNTVTIPFSSLGNPGNSMRVISTATSDEGSVRKSLTGANNSREIIFDHYIPAGATVDTVSNFAIFHAWDNTYSNDLVEIRMIGSGAGYKLGLTIPSGSYATTYAAAVLPFGSWNTVDIRVVDNQFELYLNGATTTSAVLANANSGKNIGGVALGKFYGTSYPNGTMYFDNLAAGLTATYVAPPNGGYMASSSTPGPSVNKQGLVGFI